MVYRAIGLMSGSSLDGLDIVFAELEESRNEWKYEIKAEGCFKYDKEWKEKLSNAHQLPAYNYMLLHTAYAKFMAEKVNAFIAENNLYHQVQLIGSHGHTVFHAPEKNMTSQLGDGATLAALTGINVVSDLRAMDVALNGQGAPIVPVGEKLLFPNYDFYLNIGGIANLSFQYEKEFVAFDVCPANRILNLLASKLDKDYDEDGIIAASGKIHFDLLNALNDLSYYKQNYPKSLPNSFGTETVFRIINSFNITTEDALATYTQHIITQIKNAVEIFVDEYSLNEKGNCKMLITGGGAFNKFLIKNLQQQLNEIAVMIDLPDEIVINNKEALIMALLAVLRWREENTTFASVTGASRNSIGGAVWIGQEA